MPNRKRTFKQEWQSQYGSRVRNAFDLSCDLDLWVKVILTSMFLKVFLYSAFGSSFITLLLIVSEISAKVQFSVSQGHPVTLTLGQGHNQLHNFKGLVTKYLWVKFHNSTVKTVQDISESSIYQYFKVTL